MKQQIITGLSWTALARIVTQAIQVIIGIILARLLSPDEFGLLAMVLVFVNLALVISNVGLGGAVVQRQEIHEGHLSSIYWINVAAAALTMLLLMAAAPFIASFYSQPSLVPIVFVIAVSILVGALDDVHSALMQRRMEFGRLAQIAMASALISGVVGVVMALTGFGVWSLVGRYVAAFVTDTVLIWLAAGWRPRFLFDRQAVREVLGFGLNLQGSRIVAYVVTNLDNLLVGRFLSVYTLGIYQSAYKYTTMPVTMIVPVLKPVLISSLSRIQDETERLRQIDRRITQVIAFLTIPIGFGLVVAADPFILALLGEKWADVIPVLRVMGLTAFLLPLMQSRYWLLTVVGRTDLQFRLQLFEGGISLLFFLVGIQYGINGIIVAFVLRSLVTFVPMLRVTGRLIDLSILEYLSALLPLVLVGGVMSAVVWVVSELLLNGLQPGFALLAQVIVGGVVYLGLTFGLRLEVAQETLNILREYRRSSREESVADETW